MNRLDPLPEHSPARWSRGWAWLAILFLLNGALLPRLLLRNEIVGDRLTGRVDWNWLLPFVGETNPRAGRPPIPSVNPMSDVLAFWDAYNLLVVAVLAALVLLVRPTRRGFLWVLVGLFPQLVAVARALAPDPPWSASLREAFGPAQVTALEVGLLGMASSLALALIPAVAHHMRWRAAASGRGLLLAAALGALTWHVYSTLQMPRYFMAILTDTQDTSLSTTLDRIQFFFVYFGMVAFTVPAIVLSIRPSPTNAARFLRICRIGIVCFLLKEIARGDHRTADFASTGEQLFAALTVGLPLGMARAAPVILLATGLSMILHRLGPRPAPDAELFA